MAGPLDEASRNYLQRGPRLSAFWVPRNLSAHMDRQARPAPAIYRRKVGAKHCMPWWLGGCGVKTTENKIP